jgi:uncharacterized coiled-coil DUF342 family protein
LKIKHFEQELQKKSNSFEELEQNYDILRKKFTDLEISCGEIKEKKKKLQDELKNKDSHIAEMDEKIKEFTSKNYLLIKN